MIIRFLVRKMVLKFLIRKTPFLIIIWLIISELAKVKMKVPIGLNAALVL